MNSRELAFVTIEQSDHHFVASFAVTGLLALDGNPELIAKKATKVYEQALTKMRSLTKEMESYRISHKPLPARKMWKLGDLVFSLRDDMALLSLQIDGLYEHLERDLGVKRKWLEKAIIFRRYVPVENLIPQSLNWGRFEKGTRRKAENLVRGSTPE